MSIVDLSRVAETKLGSGEVKRYARHLSLPGFGLEGQKRLKASRVLCIGAGGLGSPASLYLAAAGVGALGIIDFDLVDETNLQRQILHGSADVGRKKTDSARERLLEANSNVSIELHEVRFDSSTAVEIVKSYDLVLDGTDNFPTRYLSSDVCFFLKKPLVYGAISRFEGQCTVFAPHLGGPCYRCLFPEPPLPGMVANCSEAGVLGVLPGIIGVLQATEAIKLLVGAGDSLLGRLLHFDALKAKFREFHLQRDPECPLCSASPKITAPIDYEGFCSSAKNSKTMSANIPEITVEDLKARLDRKENFVLVDVREPFEWDIARIPGAILMPLGELPSRLGELNPSSDLVIQCKSGGRSAHAVQFLLQQGFSKVSNLAGGILAWSERIDSAVPRY
jgi:molybdopterin/thiamine biosynthesis adenylyltransferase/rhodanese-related sulfurtransferase